MYRDIYVTSVLVILHTVTVSARLSDDPVYAASN